MLYTRNFLVNSSIAFAGLGLLVGCQSGSAPQSSGPAPAAQVAEMPKQMPMVEKPKPADLTHVLTKDEPYFDGMPTGSDPKPDGTLKSGTKVLLMMPGSTYSKVVTADGGDVYTVTDGLDPITKK